MDRSDASEANAARDLVAQAWRSPFSYEPLNAARGVLEASLQKRPTSTIVLTCLGAILCDLHLPTVAREHLEKAVALGSTDRNTFFNLYVAMLATETMEDARAVLDKGAHFERDPLTWEAYFDAQAM